MLKKTLLASSVCVALTFASQGVQASPVTNLLDGFLNGFTSQDLDARRGGGARRTKSVRRTTTTSSSSSTATNKSSLTDNKSTTTTSQNNSQTTSSQANTQSANTQSANTQTANNQANTQRGYNQQGYNQQGYQNAPMATGGGMGMGSTFISSLAGAGAGVLLANMLLSPAAAEQMGTEVATPDMLTDEQIEECLAQIEKDIADAEERLANAADEEKEAISLEISKLRTLQASMLKEQLNRLKNQ